MKASSFRRCASLFQRCAVLVSVQLALVGIGCDDASPSPPTAPDVFLDVGRVECVEDLECFGGALEQTFDFIGRIEPVGAACVHLAEALPVCECRVQIIPPAGAGAQRPFEAQYYPGNRSFGCSEWSYPGCLYCGSEFPGCSVDDPTSCDAVCADMTARAERAAETPLTVTARLSRCIEGTCQVVTQLDGRCYAGQPLAPLPPELDCNLSDDELLAELERLRGRVSTPSKCTQPARIPCASASDCPQGLGCNDGVCGGCSDNCSYPNGRPEAAVCEGDVACTGAELCVQGRCILRDNIECRFFTQCAEDQSCVLSGTSSEGRGNEATRSYCE